MEVAADERAAGDGWRRLGIRAELLCPPEAHRLLGAGDIAVLRLDVRPTLDGVEAGLAELAALERRGVRFVNRPGALLAAHDKLVAARRFAAAGIAHPRTLHCTRLGDVRALEPPFVLKPRFGSWGHDVMLCRDGSEVEESLAMIGQRRWFRRQGVLVQELVPPRGYDTPVVVARGRVVGAGRRKSAPGEWRTNVALGGRFISSPPTEDEQALAIDAARAIGAELVGVDLLPDPEHGSVVLEVNGASISQKTKSRWRGGASTRTRPRRSDSAARNWSPPDSGGATGGRGWMPGVDGLRPFLATSRISPG